MSEYTTGRRQRRRRRKVNRWPIILVVAVLGVSMGALAVKLHDRVAPLPGQDIVMPAYVERDLLPVNRYSRPGIELEKIRGVVIHYVGNPNTTAAQNRSYFAGLAETGDTYASAHFLVGMEGEVLQCVPLTEVAYCSNERNSDTISIEVCHPDESGEFTPETMEALTDLTAWLCYTFDLSEKDVIRHYDVTGKLCPKYYVEHEDAWAAFIENMAEKREALMAAEKE